MRTAPGERFRMRFFAPRLRPLRFAFASERPPATASRMGHTVAVSGKIPRGVPADPRACRSCTAHAAMRTGVHKRIATGQSTDRLRTGCSLPRFRPSTVMTSLLRAPRCKEHVHRLDRSFAARRGRRAPRCRLARPRPALLVPTMPRVFRSQVRRARPLLAPRASALAVQHEIQGGFHSSAQRRAAATGLSTKCSRTC